VNVAPNFRYHLAIHLQAKPVEHPDTFLALPFVGGDFKNNPTQPMNEIPGAVTPGVDPLAAKDWALQSIDMPSAEAVQSMQTGQPLIAAVIDTGVDYN